MSVLGCEAMDIGMPSGVCRKPSVASIECLDGTTRRFCQEHLEMVRKARGMIASPTSFTAVTMGVAIECVKCAIERVEDTDRRFREVEASAASSVFDRIAARARRIRAEEEFGWQWRNVKRIFEEKGI